MPFDLTAFGQALTAAYCPSLSTRSPRPSDLAKAAGSSARYWAGCGLAPRNWRSSPMVASGAFCMQGWIMRHGASLTAIFGLRMGRLLPNFTPSYLFSIPAYGRRPRQVGKHPFSIQSRKAARGRQTFLLHSVSASGWRSRNLSTHIRLPSTNMEAISRLLNFIEVRFAWSCDSWSCSLPKLGDFCQWTTLSTMEATASEVFKTTCVGLLARSDSHHPRQRGRAYWPYFALCMTAPPTRTFRFPAMAESFFSQVPLNPPTGSVERFGFLRMRVSRTMHMGFPTGL